MQWRVQTKAAEESDSLIVPKKVVTTLEGRGGQQKASADKTSGTGDQGSNDGKRESRNSGTRSEIRLSSVIDAVCQQRNTDKILQLQAERQGSGRGRCDKRSLRGKSE